MVDDLYEDALRLLPALKSSGVAIASAVLALDEASEQWLLVLGIPEDVSHLAVLKTIQHVSSEGAVSVQLDDVLLVPAEAHGLRSLVRTAQSPFSRSLDFVSIDIGDRHFVRALAVSPVSPMDFERSVVRVLRSHVDKKNEAISLDPPRHGLSGLPDVVAQSKDRTAFIEVKLLTRPMNQRQLQEILGAMWLLGQVMNLPDTGALIVCSSGFDTQCHVAASSLQSKLKLVKWAGEPGESTDRLVAEFDELMVN
ncbi:hypothetical protein [Nocardia sp. NPDC056100]|uniref:hypothetical protein n=1 Tax=Nocardia sp. NPDC056100 TaxID=3345712 RepID=UPI0035D5B192